MTGHPFAKAFLLAAILLGVAALLGPAGTVATFTDFHDGTGNVTAADDFGKPGPSADAGGPYAVDEGRSIQLDGTNSTPSQGTIKSYGWTIISGNGSLTDASTATPTYHAPASVQSDYDVTVELTVTDNKGTTDSDTAIVTVRNTTATPAAPSVDSLSVSTTGGQNRKLDIAAAVSDPTADGDMLDTVTIEVVRVSKGTTAYTTSQSVSGDSDSVSDTTGKLKKTEEYEVRVTVSDGTGDTGTDTTTVTTGS